jgi:allantoin racemase
VREAIIRASEKLVARGANVIVLGSAGLSVMASNTELSEVPGRGVPILDTISVGLKVAEVRADLTRCFNVPVASRLGMFEKMDERNRRRLVKLFELGWDATGEAS